MPMYPQLKEKYETIHLKAFAKCRFRVKKKEKRKSL